MRLPEELRASEAEYRRAIGAVARRGKVDASFYVRPGPAADRELTLDEALLDRLVEQATTLRRRLGPEGRIDAVDLLRWPGVMKEADRDAAPLAAAAMDLLAEALAAFTGSRAAEGARIAEMLRSRGTQVAALTDEVAARLPEAQARIRAKFAERLAALSRRGESRALRAGSRAALAEDGRRRGTRPAAQPRGGARVDARGRRSRSAASSTS